MSTLLAFVLTLGILIVVHEWGHYRMAKACGVKVLRFSIGFGRVLWRHRRGADGTEFTVAMLPLGGYVRMLDGRETTLLPQERDQAFNLKPLWQRAAIVAAGPLANFILAVLLLALLNGWGQNQLLPVLASPTAGSMSARAGLQAGDRVQAISQDGRVWQDVSTYAELRWHLLESLADQRGLHLSVAPVAGGGHRELRLPVEQLPAAELDGQALRSLGLQGVYAEPILGAVKSGGAGDQAGLREGDRVLHIDGEPVPDAAWLRERVRTAHDGVRGRAMQWQLERQGQRLELAITPALRDEKGTRQARIDVVVGSAPATEWVRHGPLESIWLGARETWDLSRMTVTVFGRMLVGEASLSNLGGPVTIADHAGQSLRMGWQQYLAFLAMLSVSLGVLNLLPMPMLDGGHLLYYVFEGLSGRPVPEWWQKQLQRIGAAVLLLMMALALSNDLTRLLGQH